MISVAFLPLVECPNFRAIALPDRVRARGAVLEQVQVLAGALLLTPIKLLNQSRLDLG